MSSAEVDPLGTPQSHSVSLPVVPDEELAHHVGSGDTRAFRLLYERHSTAVYTLASHMLGDDQADEAVQEVFLRLWRKSDLFDPTRGSFRTWLLGITRNHALDKLRRLTVERRLAAADAVEALVAATDDAAPLEDDLWRASRIRAVRGCLREIPPDQRRVIELAYFGGFSQSAIAGLLATPLGTVKKRTRLALQKLRASLEQQGLGSP